MKTPLVLLLLLLTFAVFADDPKESPQNVASMSAGIEHFQTKQFEKAEAAFRDILKNQPTVPMGGKASFNLGLTLKAEKKFPEAIQVFEGILTSAVDDREPGEGLMEEFMNYRHRACLQISMCQYALGDFAKALSYVELARDKHTYAAHCATCAKGAQAEIEGRLAALNKRLNK